jgi:hypothetical protein
VNGFLGGGFDNAIGGQKLSGSREILKRTGVFCCRRFLTFRNGRAVLRLDAACDFNVGFFDVLCKFGIQHLDALEAVAAHACDAIAGERAGFRFLP